MNEPKTKQSSLSPRATRAGRTTMRRVTWRCRAPPQQFSAFPNPNNSIVLVLDYLLDIYIIGTLSGDDSIMPKARIVAVLLSILVRSVASFSHRQAFVRRRPVERGLFREPFFDEEPQSQSAPSNKQYYYKYGMYNRSPKSMPVPTTSGVGGGYYLDSLTAAAPRRVDDSTTTTAFANGETKNEIVSSFSVPDNKYEPQIVQNEEETDLAQRVRNEQIGMFSTAADNSRVPSFQDQQNEGETNLVVADRSDSLPNEQVVAAQEQLFTVSDNVAFVVSDQNKETNLVMTVNDMDKPLPNEQVGLFSASDYSPVSSVVQEQNEETKLDMTAKEQNAPLPNDKVEFSAEEPFAVLVNHMPSFVQDQNEGTNLFVMTANEQSESLPDEQFEAGQEQLFTVSDNVMSVVSDQNEETNLVMNAKVVSEPLPNEQFEVGQEQLFTVSDNMDMTSVDQDQNKETNLVMTVNDMDKPLPNEQVGLFSASDYSPVSSVVQERNEETKPVMTANEQSAPLPNEQVEAEVELLFTVSDNMDTSSVVQDRNEETNLVMTVKDSEPLPTEQVGMFSASDYKRPSFVPD
jgi:hypothetical protein